MYQTAATHTHFHDNHGPRCAYLDGNTLNRSGETKVIRPILNLIHLRCENCFVRKQREIHPLIEFGFSIIQIQTQDPPHLIRLCAGLEVGGGSEAA